MLKILKTMELLFCVLIGVCAVIRSNMVLCEINSPYSFRGIFSKLYAYITDIVKMCMWDSNAEKILFASYLAKKTKQFEESFCPSTPDIFVLESGVGCWC